MLLGQKLPAPYSDWRVVEKDLHDVARQVREYDAEAALVRSNDTGQLGLAVWNKRNAIPGGAYTLAREMFDLTTDAPLMGEPDARVMRFMRATDSRRFSDYRAWLRKVAASRQEQERRKRLEMDESFGDHSERYVHAYGKDIGSTKRAFISDYSERAVA